MTPSSFHHPRATTVKVRASSKTRGFCPQSGREKCLTWQGQSRHIPSRNGYAEWKKTFAASYRCPVCAPRGFCAGVVRAIDAVERPLAIHGAAGLNFVRTRSVPTTNTWSAEPGASKGAAGSFPWGRRNRTKTIPRLSGVGFPGDLLGAHGVPKWIPKNAMRRRSCFASRTATCPLVPRVHREAAIHGKRGRHLSCFVGHIGSSGRWSTAPHGAAAGRYDHAGRRDARRRRPLDPPIPTISRLRGRRRRSPSTIYRADRCGSLQARLSGR